MALQKYANTPLPSSPSTPFSTLSGAITDIATTLTVASATPFPTTPQFTIAIEDELLLVTGVAGAVFTVTRGVEGTAAAAHADTTGVFAPLTAASLALLPVSISETGITYGTTGDTVLARSSVGVMKLSAASATSLLLQNGAAVEVGGLSWSGNTFILGTQGGVGAGTARDTIIGSAASAPNGVLIATEATSRWVISPTGHLRPFLTATYDLGTTSELVRALYLGKIGNLTTNGFVKTSGSDGTLGIDTSTYLTSVTPHNVLSATHPDTLPGACLRGGLIVGNATPVWAALAVGPTHSVPYTADGIDISWSLAPALDATNMTGLPLTTGVTGILAGANGGTGVANTSKTITLGGNLTTSGAFATTLTVTNTTGVTLPTTGTLATLAGSEALTNKTVNGNSFTAGTYTLTGVAGKTLTFNKSLTLEGTDSTTMTFPATSATIARTDAAQTFTGSQTIAALVGPVTITEAVGSSGLTVTGATQVTSFPALNLTQTWNAVGTTFIGARLTVIVTAAANASDLWQIWSGSAGTTKQMWVDVFGALTAATLTAGTTTQNHVTANSSQLSVKSTSTISWSNSSTNSAGTQDLILRRVTSADLQLGNDLNGAAISQTIRACNGITGQNTTGGNLTLASGKGTDLGAVSSLIFQTPTVGGATSGTAQALATRITVDSSGLTLADTMDILINATTGSKIGQSGSKLAFYGSTPIVRAVLATGVSATVDNVITALQNLGLVKQS